MQRDRARQRQLPDAAQRVLGDSALRLALRRITQVLPAAAAALAEHLARGRRARRRCRDDLFELGARIARMQLRDPRAHEVAGRRERNEDDAPLRAAADAVAAPGERVDAQLYDVADAHF